MRKHLRTIVGIAVSLLLLGWAMRDVSPAVVAREIAGADPLPFALSIVVALFGFLVRAVRWGVLLRPVAPAVPLHPRFAATIVGFAANNLLPARVGEFARAVMLSRTARVSTGSAFATLVVERIFDGIVLVGLLFGAMATARFPTVGAIAGVDPRHAALALAGAMGAVGLVLFLLVAAPHRSARVLEGLARRLPERFREPIVAALHAFLHGLGVLRSVPLFVLSAALALGQWVFTAASYLLAFRAFGITHVPFAGAVFLQSFIGLAVAIPSSPGFFGPFEAGAKFGLALWNVAPDKAVSFAIGYHLAGFVPVTLLGLWYVWRYGLSWTDVRASEHVVEEAEGATEDPGRAELRAAPSEG